MQRGDTAFAHDEIEVIRAWEAEYDAIPPDSWVLMRTGWSKKSGAAYLNMREDGPHSPGPAPDGIRYLVETRNIQAFGTDADLAGCLLDLDDPVINISRNLPGAGDARLITYQTDLLDPVAVQNTARQIAAAHQVNRLIHNTGLVWPKLLETRPPRTSRVWANCICDQP